MPYAEVVTDVAKKLKVPDLTSDTLVAEVERQVVETLINMRLAKAEPEEREQMLRALGVARDGTGQALTMAAGGLVVANLSGFALYTAASSALAGVAGLFGVVLPFSVYTASSSLIATLIGPVGWVALIGITVITFGATNYKKTVPGVLCIATLRARLLAERQEEIQKIQAQKQRADLMMARLEPLRAFLDRHRELADDDPIPVSSVPGY